VLDRKNGLYRGVVIGMILTTGGLWLKCLINESFIYVIVGQTLLAAGQPFILNACSKLSANWYPENERLTSTAVGANSFVLGASIGTFMPSLFIYSDDLPPDVIREKVF
jgi:uncharacterized membrane protein YfcA